MIIGKVKDTQLRKNMKTLQEIKDEVCIEKCSCPFNELPPSREWIILDDIAERYSEERLKEWKEKFKAKLKELIDDHFSIGAMDVLNEEEIKTIIDSL